MLEILYQFEDLYTGPETGLPNILYYVQSHVTAKYFFSAFSTLNLVLRRSILNSVYLEQSIMSAILKPLVLRNGG